MIKRFKVIYLIYIARVFFPSLFFLVLVSTYSNAADKTDFSFNDIERRAYTHLLDLEFKEARTLINAHSNNATVNPKIIYIANLVDVTEIYLTEDASLYEQYQKHEKSRLNAAAHLPDNDPAKLFLQAEIKIHWAFAKLKFGQKLGAFRNLQQAYHLISKNQQQYPEFIPNYKSLGILHTLFDSFPDKYSWIPDLFGLEGNTIKGMNELKKVAIENSDFKIETQIYSAVFEAFLLNKRETAIKALKKTLAHHGELRSIKLILALLYMKNSQSYKAQPMLTKFINDSTNKSSFHLLKYYLAETYLQKGAYDDALSYYQSFIQTYAGTSYIKDAYLKMALCYYFMEQNEYEKYFQLATEKGSADSEIDKNAERMLESETLPNKQLLMIRYATDGGYYTLADSILNIHTYKDFSFPKDKTEYYYRKARLYHKQGKTFQAEGYYLKTILSQSDKNWYFGPNACLQLGYIYFDQGNCKKAVNYFNKSKSYIRHPYKYSIDTKADIGIERCEES